MKQREQKQTGILLVAAGLMPWKFPAFLKGLCMGLGAFLLLWDYLPAGITRRVRAWKNALLP